MLRTVPVAEAEVIEYCARYIVCRLKGKRELLLADLEAALQDYAENGEDAACCAEIVKVIECRDIDMWVMQEGLLSHYTQVAVSLAFHYAVMQLREGGFIRVVCDEPNQYEVPDPIDEYEYRIIPLAKIAELQSSEVWSFKFRDGPEYRID